MKQSIIGLSWTYIFLLGVFSTNAQNIKVADSLFEAKNYELASVYYEKAIFYADNSKDYNDYLGRQAELFEKTRNFEKKAAALERINKSSLAGTRKKELFYQLSFTYFMLKDYSKSYFYWLQYESTVSQEPNEDTLLLKTLLFAKLEKWGEAQSAYISYTNDSSTYSLGAFQGFKNMGKKSPEKAENLSYFLPGAGQMYAGKPLRGITSFAIQTGLLAFAAYNVFTGYYFSGTFTGVSLFYVFYMGGARHAGYLAEEYNKSLNEDAYNRLKELIEKNKKGR